MILIRHRTVVKFFQPPDRAIDNLVCEISSPESLSSFMIGICMMDWGSSCIVVPYSVSFVVR